MRNKSIKAIVFSILILIYCILIHQKDWLAVVLLCVMSTIFFFGMRYERKVITKELVEISEMLELVIQKQPLFYSASGKDTLHEKIAIQIQRIDEINRGNQRLLVKERDGIKQLLAEISHQIRTPLANMEAYLALLEQSAVSDEERTEYLKSVICAEQKIYFLVEKFMLAARMENRIIQIHKYNQDLKETVAEAVFQVYKKAENKKINIEIHEEKDRSKQILHDRNWICECIYNLLDNSIKYSAVGSKIIVGLKDNEMFTEIRVEDEGIGITPEEENKIFQLYYRGDNAFKQEGFGMGLFITREIVKKHDGFMCVKRKKQGLIMSIFLPKTGT